MNGRGAGRAYAGTALLLAVLLAIVALASGGQVASGGASDGGRPAVPGEVFTYVYALFLLAGAVSVPLFFYVYTRDTPYERVRRGRARLLLVAVFTAVVLLVVVLSPRIRDSFAGVVERLAIFDTALGDDRPRSAARPPAPDWTALALVCAIATVAVGAVLAVPFLRRRGRLGPRSLAETLTSAFDDSLDDLRDDPDPRRAIVRAYARMEQALERSGVGRHGAEAPLEYLARVLLALDVSPAPVQALTELFERAKFSQHAIDPRRKTEAITALEQIRSELRSLT